MSFEPQRSRLLLATAILALASATASRAAAQDEEVVVPDLAGIWDGGARVRPINGPNQPWTQANFPVLNERGLAFQQIFDEAIAPKYDCVASASPALQYDPYALEVVQWPDRVLMRYEKDDVLRTIWLDEREPPCFHHKSDDVPGLAASEAVKNLLVGDHVEAR